jgi:hypothetical protein
MNSEHSRVWTTLDVYGRFLPSHDQEAADTVGAALDRAMRHASSTDYGRVLDAELAETTRNRRTQRDDEPREMALSTPKRSGTVEATPGIEDGGLRPVGPLQSV